MRIKKNIPQTVVETPSYLKQAETCMDKHSRESFINYIAQKLHKITKQIVESYRGEK
jgi:hypothetical protein